MVENRVRLVDSKGQCESQGRKETPIDREQETRAGERASECKQ